MKKSLDLEPGVIAETLKHDAPYGVFPDDFSLNLIVDSFLKSGNFEGLFVKLVFCHYGIL